MLRTCMILAALAMPAPAFAQDEAPAFVRWDRLRVIDGKAGSYTVVDGYGRYVPVDRFARAVGDFTTLRMADRAHAQQRTVGTSLLVLGPVFMLVGVERASRGAFEEIPLMEGAGYALLGVGLVGTLGGVSLLRDRRVREPASWYTRDQAEALVRAYELQLEGFLGPEGAGLRLRWGASGGRGVW